MRKISKEDKIFIAGANGMAGKAIKKSFIKAGYNILLTPTRNELNLFDLEAVKKWFFKNEPNVVVIAAAKVGGIFSNSAEPTQFLLDNLKIQNNLIETSWRFGVKRLLFLASSCIYPKFATQPIQEEELLTGKLEETNQWYAIAKIAGIKLCDALREQYKFDAISLMPTNLYGPGDNYNIVTSHVMASFIRKFYMAKKQSLPSVTCFGSGSPYREFLYSDDLGSAAIFALENWDPDSDNAPLDKNGVPHTFLNVGSGFEISIKDLAYKIADLVKYKGEILWDTNKSDGTPRKFLNCKKFNQLGWEARTSLENGIIKSLDSFEKEYINL